MGHGAEHANNGSESHGTSPTSQPAGGERGGMGAALRGAGSYAAGRAMVAPDAVGDSGPQCRPPPVAAPTVVDVTAIADPVARNNRINAWYNHVDGLMTTYLGQPQVPNWATFGQHASYNAGVQIRNLDDGMGVLGDVSRALSSLSVADPKGSIDAASKAFHTVMGLLNQDGMTQQATQLGFAKAGVTQTEIKNVMDAADEVGTAEWSDLIPGVAIYEQIQLAQAAGSIAFKVASAVPAIISTLQTIRDHLITGNTQIYQNIAPVYSSFLGAANAAPNGNPGAMNFEGDSNGFVSAGFALYGEVAELACRIASTDDGAKKEALRAERQQKIERGNLLVVFHEQAIVAQPIYDLMLNELQAMSGTMKIVDPNGTFDLLPNGGNWGDLYTRMGMDPSGAPDVAEMTPDQVPGFRDESDPAAQGTIGQYFTQGTNDTAKERRLHDAPPEVERLSK